MKPRNDKQREIVALSATLPPLSQVQRRWGEEHIGIRNAFVCKGEAWCSCCGHIFPFGAPELGIVLKINERVKCPHCGANLKVEVNRRKKYTASWYYSIISTCKGYQVVRNYAVTYWIDKGGKPNMEFREAVQNWIDSEGHEEIIARPVRPLTGCYDAWNFCKPMELRTRRQSIGTYYHPDKYIINGAWVYPSKSLLPKVRRNGFCLRGCHVPPSELIKLLLSDKEAEILAKNRQFGLLDYKYRRGYREFCMPYSHAIRIARRHKYIVKDADLWMDYLDLLSHFNRDVRNPHYVCPGNLKAEHDRLHRKKARIDAAKEEERKRLEAVRWEESYKKAKGKYFGIKFGDGKITVSVIPSVAEIAEEGKAMHHCVYTAKYFNRTDSLILSARDTSGNRLETIEISLKTYKIVQSRAKFNGKSDYHDQIINLVNQNISLIKNIS